MNDPGISQSNSSTGNVDLKHETIDRGGVLNGPISISRKKRKRTAADRTRRGLDGGEPTKRQRTALRALRHYENAKRNDELPDLPRCLGGSAMLRIHVESRGRGSHYKFSWPEELCARTREERSYYGNKLGPDDRQAVEIIAAAQLLQGAQALMSRYDDLVPILGVSYDKVSKIMRKLIRLGRVAHMPIHKSSSRHYQRRANVYWITERGFAELGIAERPKVAPPPAPGMREVRARDAVNVDQLTQSSGRPDWENRELDPRNPDPTDFSSLGDVTTLPGDPEREARTGNRGAFLERPQAKQRITSCDATRALPDESTVHSGSIGFDPPRDAPPEGQHGRFRPSVENEALERYRNAQNFEQLVARGVASELKTARRALEDERRALYRAMSELAGKMRDAGAMQRVKVAKAERLLDTATVKVGDLTLAASDARLADWLEEVAKLRAIEKNAEENTDLARRLRALEEREAELDEGAAGASVVDDETGGAE